MPSPPPTIAIDFDGTICDFKFPGIGALKPFAKEAICLFKSLGFHIIVYSCRTCSYHLEIFVEDATTPVMDRPCVKDMVAFLEANDIPYDDIDDGTKGKPLADYYIDDKGVRFDNNWKEVAKFIYDRCPSNPRTN